MVPPLQRYKEEPLNKILPVAQRIITWNFILSFSCFSFHKWKAIWFHRFWRDLRALNFSSPYSDQSTCYLKLPSPWATFPTVRASLSSCQLLHRVLTPTASLSPTETFSFNLFSDLASCLILIQVTFSESFHYTLQVLYFILKQKKQDINIGQFLMRHFSFSKLEVIYRE